MNMPVRQEDKRAARTPARAPGLELTILMPCLNEAETLQVCVAKARSFLARTGVAGEVLVADNGSYGTIRAHQERRYPGRVVATDLKNPDFAAYARAFGAWAVRVERTEDFPAAFEDARRAAAPALIHLVTEVEDISPGRTISQIRAGGG